MLVSLPEQAIKIKLKDCHCCELLVRTVHRVLILLPPIILLVYIIRICVQVINVYLISIDDKNLCNDDHFAQMTRVQVINNHLIGIDDKDL